MVPSFAYLNHIKMSDLRKIITKTFNEVLEQTNPDHKAYDKEDDLVLLDSVDSGFRNFSCLIR